jgi:hypothetical protein
MMFKKVFLPLLMGFSLILLFLVIFSSTATASPPITVTAQSPSSLTQLNPLQTSTVITTVIITADKDAFIISGSGANNNAGAETAVTAGQIGADGGNTVRRGLIAFNIAGNIPAGAMILTATFNLDVVRTPTVGAVNSNFGLHQITKEWLEGTKSGVSGSAATAGEVTWNSAKHLTTTWTTAGGDFVVTPSGSTAVTGNGPYTWNSTPDMVTNVQSWLDSPAANYGWLLKSDNETAAFTARRFGSIEGGEPANLTIQYFSPVAHIYLPIITSSD